MPAPSVPLINGTAYSYSDIAATIAGLAVYSFAAINYTQEQPKENNMGAGTLPVSRGRGAKNASGSMELDMDEVEKLRDAIAGGSLLDIAPFDITVTFINGVKTVTHILKNCEFVDDGVETSQGDTVVRRSFGLVISHIVWRP